MNTAENETWGECVGEMAICDGQGRVGYPAENWYLCTGGHHVGPSRFIRCTSTFHQQDGPMSPGIGFIRLDPTQAEAEAIAKGCREARRRLGSS